MIGSVGASDERSTSAMSSQTAILKQTRDRTLYSPQIDTVFRREIFRLGIIMPDVESPWPMRLRMSCSMRL